MPSVTREERVRATPTMALPGDRINGADIVSPDSFEDEGSPGLEIDSVPRLIPRRFARPSFSPLDGVDADAVDCSADSFASIESQVAGSSVRRLRSKLALDPVELLPMLNAALFSE